MATGWDKWSLSGTYDLEDLPVNYRLGTEFMSEFFNYAKQLATFATTDSLYSINSVQFRDGLINYGSNGTLSKDTDINFNMKTFRDTIKNLYQNNTWYKESTWDGMGVTLGLFERGATSDDQTGDLFTIESFDDADLVTILTQEGWDIIFDPDPLDIYFWKKALFWSSVFRLYNQVYKYVAPSFSSSFLTTKPVINTGKNMYWRDIASGIKYYLAGAQVLPPPSTTVANIITDATNSQNEISNGVSLVYYDNVESYRDVYADFNGGESSYNYAILRNENKEGLTFAANLDFTSRSTINRERSATTAIQGVGPFTAEVKVDTPFAAPTFNGKPLLEVVEFSGVYNISTEVVDIDISAVMSFPNFGSNITVLDTTKGGGGNTFRQQDQREAYNKFFLIHIPTDLFDAPLT